MFSHNGNGRWINHRFAAFARPMPVLSGLAIGMLLAGTAWAQNAGPGAGFVPRSEYESLKSRFDALEQRVNRQDQQIVANKENFQAGLEQLAIDLPVESDNVDSAQLMQSLFGPKTDSTFFSPLDRMDPSFLRSPTALKIGQLQDLNLNVGLNVVGRFQALYQNDAFTGGMEIADTNPGFQTAWGNLSFLARIPEKMDVYFDLYIASRPHSNQMYGHEGYILLYQAPGGLNDIEPIHNLFEVINVKVGAFDIDFGDQNYRRSNNARVQTNPLIGNYVLDPNGEEIGAEVFSKPGVFNWLVGLGSGTTTEHFGDGEGFSLHGKIWVNPCEELRASGSIYWVDHSDSTKTTSMFSSNRSGGPYAAVFGGGTAPGQLLPMVASDVLALQGDVTVTHWPFEVYAHGGWVRDNDTNGSAAGSPEDAWFYTAGEVVYHVTPALYGAARYSAAFADRIGDVGSDGWVDRIQVGGGYWLTPLMLAKIEYVYERYHGFSSGTGEISGLEVWRGPAFQGVVMEFSFAF